MSLLFSYLMSGERSDPLSLPLKAFFLFILLLFFGVTLFSRFVLDYKWFESVGYPQVFLVTLTARLFLFALGSLVSFLLFLFFWRWCKRSILSSVTVFAPFWEQIEGASREYIDVTPETSVRRVIKSIEMPLLLLFALVSLLAGLGLSARWSTVLLYLNKASFGAVDPIFGKDIGFYIFTLPFVNTILNYLIALFILISLVLILAYLSFNWRLLGEEIPPSLQAALIPLFLFLAAKAYLSRFNILYSATGAVYGAGYVDVHINQYIPLIISIILLGTAIAIPVSSLISTRGSIKIPVAAVALVVVVSILGSGTAWFVQEFKVSPNEIVLEEPFIENNIRLTNKAYGLEGVHEEIYPLTYNLTIDEITDSPSIKNIRLWDHRPLLTTFQQRQEIRTYYGFSNLAVDRYHLNGELVQTWLAAREMLPDKLKGTADTWINRHLIYTHGIGVVMAPVNAVDEQGLPEMIVKDIPPRIEVEGIKITQPRIYYGEETNNYIITNTNREEFDYPMGDENQYTTYKGKGGIPLTPLNKIFSTIVLGEVKLYTSEYITEESRLHLYRNVNERAEKITPYILFDNDPHTFISSDGRIYWMLNGFLTTERYPYAEPTRFNNNRFNYIQDSVKAVIDAYNGTITYYIIKNDPLLTAYSKIYPGLFKPLSSMPEDFKAHLRYSEDLFKIQANIYTVYHMKNPEVFYNKEDRWEIPTEKYETAEIRVEPYNVLLQMDDKLQFLTILPFTPVGRDNMISWMAVKQDEPEYGEITVYKFTKEEQIYGPSQIEARIDQDETISRDLTLWGQSGSRVIRGNLLVIPYKNSIIYIEPLYLAAETGSIPELKRVIAFYNNSVAMEPTLNEALKKVLGASNRTTSREVTIPEEGTIDSLIQQTIEHYNAAKKALISGDIEAYGREMKNVERLLQKLEEETGEK
ncbi:hypothetical protein FHEFKHOI_02063 [Candidatus Methanoperedenaceae archaeon GB50]|nr:hypothetical protein FHEFKHOI_02063 [Candidatus Methanoperedenaceae archaeon GB50]